MLLILTHDMPLEKIIAESNELESIKNGGQGFFKTVYEKYRTEFTHWAIKHYNIDEEIAAETYQRTMITLYYNIKENKLTKLNSSMKTYLFAIGKNLFREHYKSTKRFEPLEDNYDSDDMDNSILDKYEQSNLQETVKGLMTKIGEPCKTVIELYYFHQYTMDSIATSMNYKTEQIAAKRKFLCLKQLKNLIEQSNDAELLN